MNTLFLTVSLALAMYNFFPLAATILRGVVVVVVVVDTIAVRIGFVFIQNLYNIKHIMCIQCTMWEK